MKVKIRVPVPREIKIGATPARISLQEHLAGDEGYNGTFNKRTGELCLDTRLIGSKRDKVFGHEINEVIKENYELEASERDLSCFANGWIEFLSQLGIELDWSNLEEG